MTTHELLLLIANAVICSAIAIRVGTFRRNGSQHRRWGGVDSLLPYRSVSQHPRPRRICNLGSHTNGR